MSSTEFSLIEQICGRVMDVTHRDGKVCILSGDSEVVWAIPLICPVCGEPWHFVGDDVEKIVATLRKKLRGFSLVGLEYIGLTSVARIEFTMEFMYARTSEVFQDLVAEVPSHAGSPDEFSAIGIILEKRRRGRDDDDIMLVVHPDSLLESVKIYGWNEDDE
jgi:hypothetical protein